MNYHVYGEVRGQLLGVSSFIPSYRLQELNSGQG